MFSLCLAVFHPSYERVVEPTPGFCLLLVAALFTYPLQELGDDECTVALSDRDRRIPPDD
jgi:hypothetical protein